MKKCIGCKYFVSLVKENGYFKHGEKYIGKCTKYNQGVVDTLCGCKEKNGEVVLMNFIK